MMIVIMLVIICTVMNTVFGFLIYARINDLEDELEWERSYNGDLMNQLKDTRYEVEEMKRKEDKWTVRRI
nr:MAG TPA: DNA-binding regulatory protein [Caudoviricetes sp.]